MTPLILTLILWADSYGEPPAIDDPPAISREILPAPTLVETVRKTEKTCDCSADCRCGCCDGKPCNPDLCHPVQVGEGNSGLPIPAMPVIPGTPGAGRGGEPSPTGSVIQAWPVSAPLSFYRPTVSFTPSAASSSSC